MSQLTSPLIIIAQPKSSFRERYRSETDRGRHRVQRFIRAISSDDQNYEYPTVEIPREWRNRSIYIRVTSVTVCNDEVPYNCVHPYPLDTPEANVIKDRKRNFLLFPVSDSELSQGRKSFRISRQKLVQLELKNYLPLFLLDSDKRDDQSTTDARYLIDRYQLNKFQLVFSITKLVQNGRVPLTYAATSAFSTVMVAKTCLLRYQDPNVRCVPRTGHWRGGEEVLLVIPRLDRRKTLQLHFEHPSLHSTIPVEVSCVDSKTVAFRTPPCLRAADGNQTLPVHIVVIQNKEEIARVEFLYYQTSQCPNCGTSLADTVANSVHCDDDETVQ